MKTRPATTGACSATCAMSAAAYSGPRRTSRPCTGQKAMRRSSAMPGPSFGFASSTSIRTPRSSCPPKTISNCAGCTSPTAAAYGAAWRSPPTPRWSWHRPSVMPCTRLSATCSCRPNCCRRCRPSSAPAGAVPLRKPCPGCVICWPPMARTSTRFPTRPIARASSAEGATLPHRRRSMATSSSCPALPVRCWTRSSRSAAALPWNPGKRRPSTW
ncbi:hypothetical protein D3C76_794860 [compost metagenome]